jgi:hypothetical protein
MNSANPIESSWSASLAGSDSVHLLSKGSRDRRRSPVDRSSPQDKVQEETVNLPNLPFFLAPLITSRGDGTHHEAILASLPASKSRMFVFGLWVGEPNRPFGKTAHLCHEHSFDGASGEAMMVEN